MCARPRAPRAAPSLQAKIKKCKTDTFEGLELGNPDRPEATNLLTIYMLCAGKTKVARAYRAGSGFTMHMLCCTREGRKSTSATRHRVCACALPCQQPHARLPAALGCPSGSRAARATAPQSTLQVQGCAADYPLPSIYGPPSTICPAAAGCRPFFGPFLHGSQDEVVAECASLRWGNFKPQLADAIIEHLRPLQVCAPSACDAGMPFYVRVWRKSMRGMHLRLCAIKYLPCLQASCLPARVGLDVDASDILKSGIVYI